MAAFAKVGKRERIMLMVLGGVAVLAVAFLFLSKGGGEPAPTEGRTFRPGTGRSATPTPSGQPTIEQVPIDSLQARDPFLPLGGTESSGSPAPSGSAAPTETVTQGTRVTLLDIFVQDGVRFASVKVGDETHNVKEGDTFAGSYRVVTITESCATFVKGDERFTLCIGQEVFK